ncbi:ABC transporter permease [Clostridiales bacterium COT073_COT-073]|nr:ABC transporter permease [Clostridiales bacterium COT073_COT-073]
MKEPGLIQRTISVKKYSFMLQQLVNRDFKVRYRGSLLGMLWSMLNPLLNMLVLSIVFSQVFNAVGNYKMYLLSGLLIFGFFSEASNLAVTAVTANFGLLTKIYFPKFILPLSKVLSSSINFIFTFIAFLILGSFMNIHIWWGYIFIVYIFACLLMFTIGISFVLSALHVFMRDVQHIYSVIITVWMYSTPILYPIDIIPSEFQLLFKANPLYMYINFFREITLQQMIPDVKSFVLCFLVGFGSFVLGAVIFVKSQKRFIYYT